MAFASENMTFGDVGTSNETVASHDRQCLAWTQKPGNPRCLNNKVVDRIKPQAQKTHADKVADELCGLHRKDIGKFMEKVTRDLHARSIANNASVLNPSNAHLAGLASSIHAPASSSTLSPRRSQNSDTAAQASRTGGNSSRNLSHINVDEINGGHSNFGVSGASELGVRGPRIKREAGSRNLGGLIKDCRIVIDMLSPDKSPSTRLILGREGRSKQSDVKCLEKELDTLLSLFDLSVAEEGDPTMTVPE